MQDDTTTTVSQPADNSSVIPAQTFSAEMPLVASTADYDAEVTKAEEMLKAVGGQEPPQIYNPGYSRHFLFGRSVGQVFAIAAILLCLIVGVISAAFHFTGAGQPSNGDGRQLLAGVPSSQKDQDQQADDQSILQINRTTVVKQEFITQGNVLIQNDTNSADAFKIQNSNGTNLLTADTLNNRITIGNKPPGQVALNVSGDITTNGALVSTTSGYSLSDQGLSIGGVLVCTANGCVSSSSPAPTPSSPTIDVANLAFLNKGQIYVGNNTFNGASKFNGPASFSADTAFGGQIQASGSINSNTGFSVNGTAGTDLSCGANELLQQAAVSGGIVTGGNCVTVAGGTVPTLQDVYDTSSPANIVLSSANGPLQVQDSLSPLGSTLFAVTNNGGGTKYFAVSASGVSVTGNVNATGQIQINGSQISSSNLSDSVSITKQGNSFNGASQLVQLNGSTQLPAVSGTNLTNLNASNVSSGTLNDLRLSGNVALLNGNQTFTGNDKFVLSTAGLAVQDAATPLGADLFYVANNNGTTKYFEVSASGAKVNGNEVCTTAGNCVGVSGGGIGGSGTAGKIAKFTGSGFTIGDSLISDDGTSVTIGGTLSVNTIAPSSALSIGAAGQGLTLQGDGTTKLTATAAGITNSIVFAAPAGSNKTITVPNASGTIAVSASGPLSLDAAGNLSCPTCLTTGGSGGVSSLNTLTGAVTISGTANQVVVTPSGNTLTLSTPQDIATTSSPQFSNVNVTGQYKVNGSQISSADLSNDANLAKLDGDQNFTGDNIFKLSTQGLAVQDATSPLGTDLFEVTDNAGTTKYFSVSATALQFNGDDVCTMAGNCTGVAGGGVGGSGTAGKIAKFTGSGFTVGDSLISDNGTTVTVGGILGVNTITPTATLTVGVSTQTLTLQGDASTSLSATSGSVTNKLVFAAPTLTNKTITIPNASGTVAVSASGPLSLDAAGNLTCPSCLTSDGSGGGSGVSTVNGLSGDITLAGTTDQIIITPSGNILTLSTPQSINTTSSPQFANINVTGQYKVNGSQIASSDLSNDSDLAKIAEANIFTADNSIQVDSGTAFQVQSASGAETLLTADTTARSASGGNLIKIGNSTGTDLDTTILVVDSAASAPTSNLSVLNGGLFYNSGTNHINVIENGAVKELCNKTDLGCGTASNPTLQNVYDNSGSPATITTSSSSKTLLIKAGASSDAANLLQVQNSSSSTVFDVDSTNKYIGINTATPNAALDVQAAGASFFDGFESGALSPFTTSNVGASNWSIVSSGVHTGSFAAKASISAGNSTLSLTQTLSSPGTVSFYWAGTNLAFSNAIFKVDGVTQQTKSSPFSYTLASFAVSSGTHTFTWVLSYGSPDQPITLSVDDVTVTNAGTARAATFNGGNVGIGTYFPNATLDVTGTVHAQASTDSATFFQLQSSSAAETLLTVDTTARSASGGNLIKIGNSTGTDADTTILQVDSASAAPTSNLGILNGGLFYNSTTNHLNVIENGAVKEICNKTDLGCGSAGPTTTLSGAYTNGAAAADQTINLSSADGGGLVIKDASTTVGSLFTVQDNTATINYLNVTSAGISTTNLSVSAGGYISIAGGATRPGSPTEGMLYYDTTTKSLLVYANGKWQADRSSTTKIVAMGSASGCTGTAPVASANPDGADYAVTSCTSAQTNINSAITALGSTGGTVYLEEGRYIIDGQINMANNVTLAGSGSGTVVEVKDGIASSFNAINASSVSRITVRDLILDGNKTTWSSGTIKGINLNTVGSGTGTSAVPGITISDVQVRNFHNEGIYFTTTKNSSVTNSKVINNAGNGVETLDSGNSYINITNNQISGSGGSGVYLFDGSYISASGNIIESSTSDGINVNGADNLNISGNIIKSNSGNGFSSSTSANNNTITGNTVNSNTGVGILLNNNSNNTVSGNAVISNGNYGIELFSATNNQISGNTVTSNSYGLEIQSGDFNSFVGNTVYGSTNSAVDTNGADYNTFSGNTFRANANGAYLYGSTYNSFTSNKILSNTNDGVYMTAGSDNNTINGNEISSNTNYGVEITQSNRAHIENNTLQNNGKDGINIGLGTAQQNSITNNKIYNNGGSGAYSGISIGASCCTAPDSTTITGNIITDTAGTGYAINLSGTSNPTNTVLSGNTFSGTGASSINDTGINTTYSNQINNNGDYVFDKRGGGFAIGSLTASASLSLQGGIKTTALPVPSQPSVATVGTAGAVTWGYEITALDGLGETAGSTERQITTGNATLNGTNYNQITWTAIPGAVNYKIYRTTAGGTPSTTGLVGTVAGNVTSFNDTGIAATTAVPTSNTSGGISVQGTALFKPMSDSATAFQIQNASGANLLSVGGYGTGTVTYINDDMINKTPTGSLLNSATYVAGSYVQLNPATNSTNGEIEYTPLLSPSSDYTAQFDFWAGGGSGADSTYLYSSATSTPTAETSASGGYTIDFDEFADKIELRYNGSVISSVAQANIDNSTWHTVKIVKSGNTFTVTYDGTQVINFTDSARTLTGSKWGLAGRSGGSTNNHRVRNFTLVAPGSNLSQIKVGNGGTSTTLLTLDSATSDPTLGINGAMYYSTSTNKLRCDQNGVWVNCDGSQTVTLQNAYDNSTSPATITTASGKGVLIKAGASADNANLFQVQSSSGTSLLNVDSANLRISSNSSILTVNDASSPTGLSVAAGANTGGSLLGSVSTTYYYKVSAIGPNGESLASLNETQINGEQFTHLSAPSAPSAALGAAGNVTGTYTYKVSFVTANGETTASSASGSISPSAQQVTVTIPTGATGTTGRNVYRCDSSGNNCLRLSSGTTVANNTSTSTTDNTASYTGNPTVATLNTATTSTNNATVSWSAITGATSYRIYRGTTPNAENVYFTSASSPFTDTGAAGTAGTVPTASAWNGVGVGTTAPAASLDVEGSALFKPAANSATAFQIQSAGGTNILSAGNSVISSLVINENLTYTTPTGTLYNNATYSAGNYVQLNDGNSGRNGEIEYTPSLSPNGDYTAQYEVWYSAGFLPGNGIFFYSGDTSTPTSTGGSYGGYSINLDDHGGIAELYYNGTLLTSVNVGINGSAWQPVKFVKAGNNFKFYFNGVKIIDYTDVSRTLTGTKWGLGAESNPWSYIHRVRNFTLTQDTNNYQVNVAGTTTFKPTSDSTDTFDIQNASGTSLLTMDTTNSLLTLNKSNLVLADATPTRNGTNISGFDVKQYNESGGSDGSFTGPLFSEQNLQTIDWTNLSINGQTTHFSTRVTGYVKPLYSETYTFYSTSDDGQRLWVNGTQLINDWTGHSMTQQSGTIALTAGVWYPIILEHYQGTSGEGLKFEWQSASQAREDVGATAGTVQNTAATSANPGANTGGSLSGAAGTTYYYNVTAIFGPHETIPLGEASINGQSFNKLSAPGAATGVAAAGTELGVGAYRYKLTVVTANGETTVGTESAAITTTSGNQEITLTLPAVPTGATGYKVYRTAVGGGAGTEALVTAGGCSGTISTTTCTDSATDLQLSGSQPAANTATTELNKAVISWLPVSGATSYRVYRGTASGAESTYQTVTAPVFTDAGTAGTAGTVATRSTLDQIGIGTSAPAANLDVEGTALFRPVIDNSAAFDIQNAAATSLFKVDTTSSTITLGSASSTPVLLVLGNKNTSGDPTCTNGAIYYNSSFNQLRACVNGGWTSFGNNDGWVFDGDETWTYASASSFTVAGDATTKYTPGTRIKATQSATVEYFVVTSSSYSSPNTTVNITGGSDYTLANSAISANAHSYAANPQGYPTWFNYTPSQTGWSSTTAIAGRFSIIGRTVTVHLYIAGTSNATTTSVGLPVSANAGGVGASSFQPVRIQDNGVDSLTSGMIGPGSGSTANVYKDMAGGVWTASGIKEVNATFTFEF